MNNTLKIIFLLILTFLITPVLASEYYVVGNLDRVFTPTSQSNYNATCFFYKDNKFKCACKEPVNLKIWTSGDITRIKGYSLSRTYGYIKDCNSEVNLKQGF